MKMSDLKKNNPGEQLNVVARSIGAQLVKGYAIGAEHKIDTLVTVTPSWGSRGQIAGGAVGNFLNLSGRSENVACGINYGNTILGTTNYWSPTAFNNLIAYLISAGQLQPGQNLSNLLPAPAPGPPSRGSNCQFTRPSIIPREQQR